MDKATSKLTKQGVRDLGRPVVKRIPKEATCFHDWHHLRDCIGCWGRDLGGHEDYPKCEERCRKCDKYRLV